MPHPRLTVVIAALMAAASVTGLAASGLYRDNLLVASGWRGNDLVTLLVAVPALLAANVLAARGSVRARLTGFGLLFYALYNYAFYLFGAAFNALFLPYAALFTLSLVALALGLPAFGVAAADPRFPPRPSHRWVAAWLVLVALGLGVVHIGTALAFIATGALPPVVLATGHPTNVVAALDLSLVVAPSLLAARLLLARHPWGVVLAAMVNAKGAVYMPALAAATLAAWRAGAPVDPGQAVLWAVVGAGCLAALTAVLAGVRSPAAPDGVPRAADVH